MTKTTGRSTVAVSGDDGLDEREKVFPGAPQEIGAARRFLATVLAGYTELAGRPELDDAVLCLSELATNSVLHSRSGRPGGTFTVTAQVRAGEHVRIEVRDAGGPWREPAHTDGRPHGLEIVRALAAGWGRDGDEASGWRVWAQLDWP